MIPTRWLSMALAGSIVAGTLAEAGSGVGDKAPDFNPKKWWNSRPTSMGKLAGKAVLLEFFATW
jgi:hypothetical protein